MPFSVGTMSLGRQEAYEIFRRDYHENLTIDDNKHVLKQRYAQAKTLGEQVNLARNEISKFLICYRLQISYYAINFKPAEEGLVA